MVISVIMVIRTEVHYCHRFLLGRAEVLSRLCLRRDVRLAPAAILTRRKFSRPPLKAMAGPSRKNFRTPRSHITLPPPLSKVVT